MPYILAGGSNLGIASGRLLDFTGRGHTDLLVTLINLMGFDDTTFGVPEVCQGALAGLT